MRKATKAAPSRDMLKRIRTYYGDNGLECRVRVTVDGRILRNGLPDPCDRSRDYWHEVGSLDDWQLATSLNTGRAVVVRRGQR